MRCRVQQQRLLVLAEETAIATDDASRDRHFKTLAIATQKGLLATELPDILLSDTGQLPVRLYLRQKGEAGPYAAAGVGNPLMPSPNSLTPAPKTRRPTRSRRP